MTKKTNAFNIILSILTIIMIFPIVFYVYMIFWGKDKLPTGITSTYVTTITDPGTNIEYKAIEANYYANQNGKGKEVVELLFNCYSGVDKQAVYSRGFQLIYDSKDSAPVLYYYDRYDGVSFETGHKYVWGDPLIVDIDGKTFALRMDGTYNKVVPERHTGGTWLAIATLGISALVDPTSVVSGKTVTYDYTLEDLLIKLKSIIKSSSNSTGDSVVPLIDLGDFLHIYELDNKGAVLKESVGSSTIQNSYFTMQTHYDKRGLVWAKQSLFRSVAYNSDYNVSGLTDNVEYWQARSIYSINQNDFTTRKTNEGNYYSLSFDKLSEIKKYDNLDIEVVFDISKLNDDKVLGFDYYALKGLRLKSLTIMSNSDQNFTLLTDSLKNSSLTNIYTFRVNLINNNSGVDL